MSISFRALTRQDTNYSRVIDLYREAFPAVRYLPSWILRFRMRNGKAGFSALYEYDTWIGFIYTTDFRDIVCVQFFAISESRRSGGYGSKVLDSIREIHSGKRIVLTIEELDPRAENYQQRVKRKAFYEKNGFRSSGYFVKEPAERLELLILGGSISKDEVESMYSYFLGHILGFLIRPEIIEVS